MPEREPTPPAADLALGLGFYASRRAGVPGRIKTSPETFRVREVSSYPRPDPLGPYAILRVESTDWEQHELADALARRLGLSRGAITWAGTKDRRAVAERLFAYRGELPPPGDLGLPRVRLVDAYRARDGLVLGQHYANAFEILVREVGDPSVAAEVYRTVAAELRAAGGVPNFFGPQRFGEVRPVTHVVGRWIVRGDLPRAIDAYLVDRPETGTAGVGDAARAAFRDHRDPSRALREFPSEYRFERALLDRLARGDRPARALHALPYELRRLFVHAYQAFLFNRYLSARHAAGIPLTEPVTGDRVVRLGRDGTYRGSDTAAVAEDNLAECQELVRRGRASVAGPLVGLATGPTAGEPGRLLAGILAEEQVAPEAFGVPAAPELASEGTWRPLMIPVPPIDLQPADDGLWFRFSLPKGAYATVLLREFLKPAGGCVAVSVSPEPSIRAVGRAGGAVDPPSDPPAVASPSP